MVYLPHEQIVRKYHTNRYAFDSRPVFIITISLIELSCFVYYAVTYTEPITTTNGLSIPIDSVLIYRPDKRSEIWRFFLYTLLHSGWIHLIFNLLVQVLVGIPLEMIHGSIRIGAVYMSGILASSLGASIFEPDVYLVGASGGVYALLAAHLANVFLNYNQIDLGMLRVFGVLLIVSADVVVAIYGRFREIKGLAVSYVAHLCGALAGLTIGVLVLKNCDQKSHYHAIRWTAFIVYGACLLFALLYNIYS